MHGLIPVNEYMDLIRNARQIGMKLSPRILIRSDSIKGMTKASSISRENSDSVTIAVRREILDAVPQLKILVTDLTEATEQISTLRGYRTEAPVVNLHREVGSGEILLRDSSLWRIIALSLIYSESLTTIYSWKCFFLAAIRRKKHTFLTKRLRCV